MRKLLVAGLAALCVAQASAAEAKLTKERACPRAECMSDWTPFALTVFGPVGLPWGDWNVKGLQIGIVNSTYEFSGLQIGGINVTDRYYKFTLNLKDLRSGEIVWTDEQEIRKEQTSNTFGF